MASSSKNMRRSPRNASPRNASPETAAASHEVMTMDLKSRQPNAKGDPGDDWVEPALRPPAPSFEDHGNPERQGVLASMAPLGTMPNQKIKLRVKHYDPHQRRSQSGKNREAGRNGESAKTAENGASKAPQKAQEVSPRRPETKNVEMTPRNQVLKEKVDEDTPKPTPVNPASSIRTPNTRNTSTPSMKTVAGQERLRQVVDVAVERARKLNNETLGLAIRRLFQESSQNQTLADLLDAVLSQQPTERQSLDFQAYIKVARRQIKMEGNASKSTPSRGHTDSKATSKSSSKEPRRSLTRNKTPKPDASETMTSATPAKRPVNGIVTDASMRDEGPPTKRSKRSGSASSTSSLSSTHSLELETDEMAMIDEPISTPAGPKARGPPGPKLHTFPGKQTAGVKRSAGAMSSSTNKIEKDDAGIEELAAKKRKMLRRFDDVKAETSDMRDPPTPSQPDSAKRRKFPALNAPSVSRLGRREDPEEVRSPASSALGEFLVPPPPGAMRASRSRGATPNPLGRPRNAPKRSARIKMSPMKKKSGVVAGVARATRLREQSVEQTDDGDGENVDYCAACGGNGELLCCDGCTRAFHFRCLDPPMTSNQPPEGEWFCFNCDAKQNARTKPSRGLFSGLMHRLEKQNPVAFSLPTPIREYFEGVKTGEEGEYEEVSTAKNKNHRAVPGYDELHNDNFRIKDAKNNVILCFACGKSALEHREIISCDYCNLKWHLDCLSPPLANRPFRDLQHRQKHSWMCPAHVEQEMRTIGYGGRMHKVRRPKNAKVVDTALRRGLRNNGIIEIENDPSDAEDFVGMEDSVIYRLSEQGIKLDFLDRIKRDNAEAEERRKREERAAKCLADEEASRVRQQRAAFNSRSIIDKQAALSLADFAGKNADLAIDGDQMQPLINKLISEAPSKVVALAHTDEEKAAACKPEAPTSTASVPPTPPVTNTPDRSLTSTEKQQLLLIQELIRRRLSDEDGHQ